MNTTGAVVAENTRLMDNPIRYSHLFTALLAGVLLWAIFSAISTTFDVAKARSYSEGFADGRSLGYIGGYKVGYDCAKTFFSTTTSNK